MTAKPFPILIIAPTDGADAVAASGLIKRLTEEVAEPRFTIVASANIARMFAQVPNLVEIIEIKPGAKGMGLWSKVRGRRWGLVLDLQGTGVSGWLSRQRRAEWKAPHVAENRVVTAARLLGLAEDPPAPHLFTSPAIEEAADEALFGEGPIIGVAPGASWIGRVWPSERFGQVAAKLLLADGPLSGGRIIAFGGEGDREAMLTAKFPLPRNRIVLRPYDQDYLMGYAWMKRLRFFMGCDNAWTQLAAAAGVPTLALFGPTDEAVRAPYGDHARTVRGPRGFPAFAALDPKFDQQISHMTDLSVETVLKAAKELLRATEPKRG